MAVRQRKWKTASGEEKSAWVADYFDQGGKRHLKSFATKRAAKEYESKTHVEVMGRIHVADADTITVAEAGDLWLAGCRDANLEPTTVSQYEQHLRLHIKPLIGHRKLTEVTVPAVRAFLDAMRDKGRSPAMLRAVRVSLGSILSDAQERGLVVRNAVKDMSRDRKARSSTAGRHKRLLQVGVDIPTPDEIRRMLAAAEGWRRVFLMTAVLTGMRGSELRGLPWSAVDLAKGEITIRQRADLHRQIGSPKSKAGRRTIPIGRDLVAALVDWRRKCPKGELDLVFPNGQGRVEFHVNLVQRTFLPIQTKAGVCVPSKEDIGGNPVMAAKYSGLHALRHFYASLCINRRIDGGLELPAKVVQTRLGHSSIMVTLDTYGHLFPSADSSDEMSRAESVLLNV